MTELTKKMVEERAVELSNIYWKDEEIETGWHWENSGVIYKDDFRRMATYILASELRARIDELSHYQDWIVRSRVKVLTEQLKDLGEV